MITVCCWCRRQTKNGKPSGYALHGAAYEQASHGFCEECANDFESGMAAEAIRARASARVEHLAQAGVRQ